MLFNSRVSLTRLTARTGIINLQVVCRKAGRRHSSMRTDNTMAEREKMKVEDTQKNIWYKNRTHSGLCYRHRAGICLFIYLLISYLFIYIYTLTMKTSPHSSLMLISVSQPKPRCERVRGHLIDGLLGGWGGWRLTRWMGGWRDGWLEECTNNRGLVELNEF